MKVKNFIKKLFKEDLFGDAAKISFYLTLSIIPIITLSILITNFFFDSYSSQIVDFLLTVFPTKLANFIQSILQTLSVESATGVNIVTLLILVFSSSKSADELLKALAPKSNKSFLKRRKKAIFLMLICGLGFLIVFLSILFKEFILMKILSTNIFWLFPFLAQIVTFILIFLLVVAIYKFAKDSIKNYKKILMGALFFTVSWMLLLNIFSLYLNFFLNMAFGNINLMLALIIFIYVSNILLLTGNEINNNLD